MARDFFEEIWSSTEYWMEYELSNRTSIESVADRQIYGDTLPPKMKNGRNMATCFEKKKKEKKWFSPF